MRISIIIYLIYILAGIFGYEGEFSIGLIADIHYSSDSTKPDFMRRLVSAVELINEKTTEENIEIVIILGDLAWNSISNIQEVINALNKLDRPYVPLIGNGDVAHWADGGKTFNELFESHFTALSHKLKGWEKAKVPVIDPKDNKSYYLMNYAFELRGLKCICSDWNSRLLHNTSDVLKAHQAHLYDFKGGSWHFFTTHLSTYDKSVRNNILSFSHIPMHHSPISPIIKMDLAAFSMPSFLKIKEFTRKYADYFAINFAGHYHYPLHLYVFGGGYEIIVQYALKPLTDAVKFLFYKPRIGLLRVIPKTDRFEYRYKYSMVPYEI